MPPSFKEAVKNFWIATGCYRALGRSRYTLVNYSEAFAHAFKLPSIHCLIENLTHFILDLHQMNAITALTHRRLEENMSMEVPIGILGLSRKRSLLQACKCVLWSQRPSWDMESQN